MNLNLQAISFDAYEALKELDKTYVGTHNYMGIAYFWAYDYRHYLRDATTSQRRRVHQAFVAFNLPVMGESAEHEILIKRVMRIY